VEGKGGEIEGGKTFKQSQDAPDAVSVLIKVNFRRCATGGEIANIDQQRERRNEGGDRKIRKWQQGGGVHFEKMNLKVIAPAQVVS